MLNVFYTIDTEFWPRKDISVDFQRDIFGHTPQGDFGLEFQLKMFAEHGLKAVCFVEPLHTIALGNEFLKEIIRIVRKYGHDLQLHLHTEWLSRLDKPLLPSGRHGQNLHCFTEEEQTQLIALGIEKLRDCNVESLAAFRAGNYGADNATLRALVRNGIKYDSSYNIPYLDSECKIQTDARLNQPAEVEGLLEIPINNFRDFRGLRHTQLCACSSEEMENVLLQTWKKGWNSFVIVSHSFELIQRGPIISKCRVNRINVKRFQRLCRFLSGNRDKFRTCTFSAVPDFTVSPDLVLEQISMNPFLTFGRLLQQARQRLPF